MKVKSLPSKERILELLDYDKETGIFTWKKRNGKGGRKAGSVAGRLHIARHINKEYLELNIDKSIYQAHRIAFFLETGLQPPQVDHKDGNGLNNKISNLREANNQLNTNNASMRKDNTSGVIGVSWDKRGQRWSVTYGSAGFRKKYGTSRWFKDFFEAVCCRKSWENQYGMTELKKHRKT